MIVSRRMRPARFARACAEVRAPVRCEVDAGPGKQVTGGEMKQTIDATQIFFLVCVFALVHPSLQDGNKESSTSSCCEECIVTKTLYKKIYKYVLNKHCGKTFVTKKEAEVVDCGDWWHGEKCVKYRTVYKEITPFKCVSETISKVFLTCDLKCKCESETAW